MRLWKASCFAALLYSAFTSSAADGPLFGFSSVERVENEIILSWPKAYWSVRPEIKVGTAVSWATVPESVQLQGNFYSVTKQISDEIAFFRLVTLLNDDT